MSDLRGNSAGMTERRHPERPGALPHRPPIERGDEHQPNTASIPLPWLGAPTAGREMTVHQVLRGVRALPMKGGETENRRQSEAHVEPSCFLRSAPFPAIRET